MEHRVSNYWINDALNTAYGEIDYLFSLGGGDDGPSFRAGINTLDQRTVGDDLIEGAPYNTYQASASYRGFVLTGAVSDVGDEADIQKPFGFSTSTACAPIFSGFPTIWRGLVWTA